MTLYEQIKDMTNNSVTIGIMPYRDTNKKNVGYRISMIDELTTKTIRKDFLFESLEKVADDNTKLFDSILYSTIKMMYDQLIDERPNRLKKNGDDKNA